MASSIVKILSDCAERVKEHKRRRKTENSLKNFIDLNENEFGKIPQNCPVATNEFITSEIVAIIEGNRQFSNQRFEMQNNIKFEGIKTKQLF